jgi:glycosyltransferase involved in cell wall biosynthesis
VATARNFGVNQARAALIAFLDDDDIWLPHKLERQMAAWNDSPGAGGVSAFNLGTGNNTVGTRPVPVE